MPLLNQKEDEERRSLSERKVGMAFDGCFHGSASASTVH